MVFSFLLLLIRLYNNFFLIYNIRTVEVPESCKGVARFTFEYLCGRPVGAADYIAVAKNYHTIFISEIPAMSMEIRDKVKILK